MKYLLLIAALALSACSSIEPAPRPVPSDYSSGGVCDEWCQAQYAEALSAWEEQTASKQQDAEAVALAIVAGIRSKFPKLGDLPPEKFILASSMCRLALRRLDRVSTETIDWCGELLAPNPVLEGDPAPEEALVPVPNPA